MTSEDHEIQIAQEKALVSAMRKRTRCNAAVAALNGYCANPDFSDCLPGELAVMAVESADALLATLEVPQ